MANHLENNSSLLISYVKNKVRWINELNVKKENYNSRKENISKYY